MELARGESRLALATKDFGLTLDAQDGALCSRDAFEK